MQQSPEEATRCSTTQKTTTNSQKLITTFLPPDPILIQMNLLHIPKPSKYFLKNQI